MEKIKRVLNDEEMTRGNTDDRAISPEEQAMELLKAVTDKLEARKQRPS
jgi:hypothetical protein